MTQHVYRLIQPVRQTTPVIFASPHSGAGYEAAFLAQTVLDARQIRSSEDAFVDRLFDMAPAHGAPLLAAMVPRAYLDLNRAPDELDPALIEGIARAPHNPRVSSGLGVIPRVVAGGRAIYRGKLPLAVAEARITRFWHPYHRALREMIETTHTRFGQAVLIDCHSMPHEAIDSHTRPGSTKPEVVLGDRFGAAAAPWVTEAVEAAFAAEGFRVARNTPFAGAFIAQSYGRPSGNRHVVQVEIDRASFM
jgi:N-formylglutamate amidohydrolase